MIYKNEKQLLNIIKFTPPIVIITISIIITFLLYLEKQHELKKERISIENQYTKENKELVQKDIENLYNFIIRTQETTEEELRKTIKEELMKLIIYLIESIMKIKIQKLKMK